MPQATSCCCSDPILMETLSKNTMSLLASQERKHRLKHDPRFIGIGFACCAWLVYVFCEQNVGVVRNDLCENCAADCPGCGTDWLGNRYPLAGCTDDGYRGLHRKVLTAPGCCAAVSSA